MSEEIDETFAEIERAVQAGNMKVDTPRSAQEWIDMCDTEAEYNAAVGKLWARLYQAVNASPDRPMWALWAINEARRYREDATDHWRNRAADRRARAAREEPAPPAEPTLLP